MNLTSDSCSATPNTFGYQFSLRSEDLIARKMRFAVLDGAFVVPNSDVSVWREKEADLNGENVILTIYRTYCDNNE